MEPHLQAAIDGASDENGDGWRSRDEALAATYRLLGDALNSANVGIEFQPAESHVRQFWGRPFRVPNVAGSGDEGWVTTLLAEAIEDPTLKALCEHRPIGAAEQHIDSTDVLEHPSLLASFAAAAYKL